MIYNDSTSNNTTTNIFHKKNKYEPHSEDCTHNVCTDIFLYRETKHIEPQAEKSTNSFFKQSYNLIELIPLPAKSIFLKSKITKLQGNFKKRNIMCSF